MSGGDGYPSAKTAVGALTICEAGWLLADAYALSRVELLALCLLPAALAHVALTVPDRSALARLVPGLVSTAYVVCVIPAALGVRAVPRQHALADVVESLGIALVCGAGLALGARLARAVGLERENMGGRVGWLVAGLLALGIFELHIVTDMGRLLGPLAAVALPIVLWLASSRPEIDIVPTHARGAEEPTMLSLEQIARGMAHATIKPVTAIAQRLKLLSEETVDIDLRGELSEAAALMEQIQRLVGDVLDLARAQSRLKQRRVNLARVVDQAVSDVLLRFPDVRVTIDSCDLVASADETAIRTMLVNLLENAAEAADSSGEIAIELAPAACGGARLRVIDCCGGVVPEVEGRIFDAFETSKPRGTGLGLTVAREICRAHGGDLIMRAAVGETVMEAHLPDERS